MKKVEKYLINNRICPQPMYWNDLYNILVRSTGDKDLPKPLILGAWHYTSDATKLERFEHHLDLTEKENITLAMEFLDSLEEEKWYKGKKNNQ